MRAGLFPNPFAYIPAACWTRTRDDDGQVANTCYACHVPADAPNFVGDDDACNAPATCRPRRPTTPGETCSRPLRAPRETDAEVLAYARRGNYFDDAGEIALAAALAPLPAAWDGEGDRRWDGYRPDAYFRFDDRGFDRRPDGSPTGWRAYAFTPVVGSFPSNGAMSDALIRLAAPYREDARGAPDLAVYAVNLAITEALIKRADVPLEPAADERALGVDLDRDGRLGSATRVAFDGRAGGVTSMRWVGRAGAELAAGRAPIAVGLFPMGTELLHSLRYFDVRPDGAVTMAPRMKELRYARKARVARVGRSPGAGAVRNARSAANPGARGRSAVAGRSRGVERPGLAAAGVHRGRGRPASPPVPRGERHLRGVPRRDRRHQRQHLLVRAQARASAPRRRLVPRHPARSGRHARAAASRRKLGVHALSAEGARRRPAARERRSAAHLLRRPRAARRRPRRAPSRRHHPAAAPQRGARPGPQPRHPRRRAGAELHGRARAGAAAPPASCTRGPPPTRTPASTSPSSRPEEPARSYNLPRRASLP